MVLLECGWGDGVRRSMFGQEVALQALSNMPALWEPRLLDRPPVIDARSKLHQDKNGFGAGGQRGDKVAKDLSEATSPHNGLRRNWNNM